MTNSGLLYLWIAGLFVGGMLGVPLWGLALYSLAYGAVILLLHYYRSMFWLAYLIHGVWKCPERALPIYAKAYQHGARVGPPMIAYAMLLMETEDYLAAKKILQEVQKLKNLKPQLDKISRSDLALACAKTGELAEAIAIMEQIPADFEMLQCDYYTTLGYYYIEAGEFEKAEAANAQALDLEKNCAEVFDNQGLIAWKNGNMQQAEAYFQKALDLDASMASPRYYLGCIAEFKGNWETAAACFREAWETGITGLSMLTRSVVEEKYIRFCSEPLSEAAQEEIT